MESANAQSAQQTSKYPALPGIALSVPAASQEHLAAPCKAAFDCLLLAFRRSASVIEAGVIDFARALRASLTWGWTFDPAQLKVHMEQICEIRPFYVAEVKRNIDVKATMAGLGQDPYAEDQFGAGNLCWVKFLLIACIYPDAPGLLRLAYNEAHSPWILKNCEPVETETSAPLQGSSME